MTRKKKSTFACVWFFFLRPYLSTATNERGSYNLSSRIAIGTPDSDDSPRVALVSVWGMPTCQQRLKMWQGVQPGSKQTVARTTTRRPSLVATKILLRHVRMVGYVPERSN